MLHKKGSVHSICYEKITMEINSTGIIRAKFIGRHLSSIFLKSNPIVSGLFMDAWRVFS